jgi:hypothetical protein
MTEPKKTRNANSPLTVDRVGRVVRKVAEWTPEQRAGLVEAIGERWPEAMEAGVKVLYAMIDRLRAQTADWAALDGPRVEELKRRVADLEAALSEQKGARERAEEERGNDRTSFTVADETDDWPDAGKEKPRHGEP